ncbi:Neuronal PAS domain containing protein 3, partial [Dissostichus eleginoides]
MIRIFPDFSVQVTASGVGGPGVGGGGSGGMGPQVGRIPGTSNGNPQNLQGINAYQQSLEAVGSKHDINHSRGLRERLKATNARRIRADCYLKQGFWAPIWEGILGQWTLCLWQHAVSSAEDGERLSSRASSGENTASTKIRREQ